MNILGQEQPVIYKMDDMFDPATAQLFLAAQQNYANAVRQDYMQGMQDLKEYVKDTRSFSSPFAKDNDAYYNLTLGGASKLYDDLRRQGIDPMRSIEGRSAIYDYIYSRPYQDLANLKRSAEVAKEYMKDVRDLQKAGQYDREFDEYANALEGNSPFKDYDTLKSGRAWNGVAHKYTGIRGDTEEWFKDVEPIYKGMEGGNRVYELNSDDLKNIAKAQMPVYLSSAQGKFQLHKTKEELRKANPMLSDKQLTEEANNKLLDEIVSTNRNKLKKKEYESDPFKLASFNSTLDLNAYEQKKKIDQKYDADGNGGGVHVDIFEDADRRIGTGTGAVFPVHNGPAYRVNPPSGKGITRVYDNSGRFTGYYNVPKDELGNVLVSKRWMYTNAEGFTDGPHKHRSTSNNLLKMMATQADVDESEIAQVGTYALGELRSKDYKQNGENNRFRGEAVNIWFRAPRKKNGKIQYDDKTHNPILDRYFLQRKNKDNIVFYQDAEEGTAPYMPTMDKRQATNVK